MRRRGGRGISFSVGGRGRGGRNRGHSSPRGGFDFRVGLEMERVANGSSFVQGARPPAQEGHLRRGAASTRPTPPSKLMSKMSGLRATISMQRDEKQEAASKEEAKQKEQLKRKETRATDALAAVQGSEDPRALRSAATLGESFSALRSEASAARARAQHLDDVDGMVQAARAAAENVETASADGLESTLAALRSALVACRDFKRFNGQASELKKQLQTAEERRTHLQDQARRMKAAAAGLKAAAISEDPEEMHAAVTAAVVFEMLSKETAALQSRVARLEQVAQLIDRAQPDALVALRRPSERIECIQAALRVCGEFTRFEGRKAALREQLANADAEGRETAEPRTGRDPRRGAAPRPAAVVPSSGGPGRGRGRTADLSPADAPAAVPSRPDPSKARTNVELARKDTAPPATEQHGGGLECTDTFRGKPQPKTVAVRIHKDVVPLTLPMLGGDYVASRSAKESSALSRKRKELLKERQIKPFRVDGYYTSAPEEGVIVSDPRRQHSADLGTMQYRPVHFQHDGDVSDLRLRTVFVDRMVSPTSRDDVRECFSALGRVHKARVWAVPQLMDQPPRCFALVTVTTTAAAMGLFIAEVLASVATNGKEKGDGEVSHTEEARPGTHALRLSCRAIRAGSSVVIKEDEDGVLVEAAQKELNDAQNLLSSIDASVASAPASPSDRTATVLPTLPNHAEDGSRISLGTVSPGQQIDERVARFKHAVSKAGNESVFAMPSYFVLRDDNADARTNGTMETDEASRSLSMVPPVIGMPADASPIDAARELAPAEPVPAPGPKSERTHRLAGVHTELREQGAVDTSVDERQRKLRKPWATKKIPAIRTSIRSSGLNHTVLSTSLAEHFATRCSHRIVPTATTLDNGLWYLGFADEAARDQAFDLVNGSIFAKAYAKLKLEKCSRTKEMHSLHEGSVHHGCSLDRTRVLADSLQEKRAKLKDCILAALKRVAMKECWRLAIEKPSITHLEGAMPRYLKEARDKQAADAERERHERRRIEQQRALAVQQHSEHIAQEKAAKRAQKEKVTRREM